jgi:hypothetical protein
VDSASRQFRQVGRCIAVGLVLAVALVSLGAAVGPGNSLAANAIQSQYGNKPGGGWYFVSPSKVAYFGSDGWYTGRWMVGTQYQAMVNRISKGVQTLGTGAGTGYSPNATGGVAIAEKLKTVAVGAGTIASVRGLKGDTLGLMSRLKSYGLLKSLGTIGLAATSFEVGWKIGSQLASVFGFGKSEENPTGTIERKATEATAVSPGDNLCYAGEGSFVSGPCMGKPFPAPQSGFVVQFQPLAGGSPTPLALPDVGGQTEGACVYAYKFIPKEAERVDLGTRLENCGAKKGFPTAWSIYFIPLSVEHLPGEVFTKPATTKETAGQTPENQEKAQGIVEQCLASTACSKLAGWWWNHDPEAKEATHYEGFHNGVDPADPLAVQIPAPKPGEKYAAYDARLEALKLTPEPVVLGEAFIDPRVGPEEVSATVPHIGSNVDAETKVRVRYNPAGAPEGEEATGTEPSDEGASGGSSWSPPAIPVVDMAPLSGLSPCGVFPFGLFCWLGEAFAQFDTSGTCPHFSAPVADTGSNFGVTLCGETAETIMGYLRPAILLAFTVGLGFLFARGTKAIGGD